MSRRAEHLDPFAGWPRPLAFVLSGGGALGAAQVGMLQALVERDVRPDLIVGSSIGAIHGAFLASRPDDPDDAVATLQHVWATMNRRRLLGTSLDVMSTAVRRRCLADPGRLGSLIDEHLDDVAIEDLPVRFAAVATDVLTGDPTVLSRGSLRSALLASAAVPGIYPAVDIDGQTYVDGAVSANVPIRQAISLGAASVVCLDLTSNTISSRPPSNWLGAVLHSTSMMMRNQRANAVDELARRHRIATLPIVTPPDLRGFDFTRTGWLFEQGREKARVALDAWALEAELTATDDDQAA